METESHESVTARISPVHAADDIEGRWLSLEPKAILSPFLCWAWIGRWISNLGRSEQLYLIQCECKGEIVALGLFALRERRRLRGFIRSQVLHLGDTGNEAIDPVTAEYSGLLVKLGYEKAAYEAFYEAAGRSGLKWDEWRITATLHADQISDSLQDKLTIFAEDSRADYFVDLNWLRANNLSYEAVLPSAIRAKLRKLRREMERLGPLKIESPADVTELHQFLSELERLHQLHWRKKGEMGAFGAPRVKNFLESLITTDASRGFTEILRISAGETVLGYQCNLCIEGRIYNYVSGIDYEKFGHLSPGYAVNALLVERGRVRGDSGYYFMAGNQPYKKNLCTHVRRVDWVVAQKPLLRFRIERTLRAIWTFCKSSRINPNRLPSGTTIIDRLSRAGYLAACWALQNDAWIDPVLNYSVIA